MDRYFEIQLDNGATYVAVSDDALSMKNGDFSARKNSRFLFFPHSNIFMWKKYTNNT